MNDTSKNSPFGRQTKDSGAEPAGSSRSNGIGSDASAGDHPAHIELPSSRPSALARGRIVRFFNFLMTLAIVASLLFVGAIWYGTTEFDAPGPLEAETTFTVPKGATFASIVPGLEESNIIKKQGVLRIFTHGVKTSGRSNQLKAGEFAFTPGMSMRQVMEQLTEGRAIQHAISFPEGWTSFRMMERVASNERLEGDVPDIPPEGTLMPDTYLFQRGTTRAQILERLQRAQKKAVEQVWNSRAKDLPLRSPEELVILASLIEKETGIAGERRHVASVFVNRLRKGMRLQTDPTIIYGLWGGRGKPGDRGGLSRSEIDKVTAYNTYHIDGLPPGPIANPGIESLRAAANPLQTDDLYFVADGTGGHAFAKTLNEHNKNVAKWRQIEAQRERDAKLKPEPDNNVSSQPPVQDN